MRRALRVQPRLASVLEQPQPRERQQQEQRQEPQVRREQTPGQRERQQRQEPVQQQAQPERGLRAGLEFGLEPGWCLSSRAESIPTRARSVMLSAQSAKLREIGGRNEQDARSDERQARGAIPRHRYQHAPCVGPLR